MARASQCAFQPPLQLQHRRAVPDRQAAEQQCRDRDTDEPPDDVGQRGRAGPRASAAVSRRPPWRRLSSVTTVATPGVPGALGRVDAVMASASAAATEIGAVSRLPGISTRRCSPPAMARKKASRRPQRGSAVPAAMRETTTIRLESVSTSPRSPSTGRRRTRDGHFTTRLQSPPPTGPAPHRVAATGHGSPTGSGHRGRTHVHQRRPH